MAERRSLFQMWFGRTKTESEATRLQMINGYSPSFQSPPSNIYNSDVVRAIVDAFARHVGKLKPKHVRRVGGVMNPAESPLDRILSVQPNEHMDAFTFYYKVATQYLLKNNAFVLRETDEAGRLKALYPLDYSAVELMERANTLYCKFTFLGGKTLVVPYAEVIHLRRHFNSNDIFGDSNEAALYPALELVQTTNDGIINAVKSSAYIRGLLKFTNNMINEKDKREARDAFIRDYMSSANSGGVAVIDAKADYQELKNEPKMVDAAQMGLIDSKFYTYFGISKEIVTGNYTEEQFNAFYSAQIEPLAIQMSLEFTRKEFTDRELGYGNEIIFSANRLTFASVKTKVELAKELVPLGLFSINEIREIFELEPVEDGDKRLQTLNVVDFGKANQYQGVEPTPSEGGEKTNDNA